MSRQDGAVLHHVDRSFWEYAEKMDGGRMSCKFCGHEFAKDTSISRIKHHLAGVKGRGVRICGQVPQDVQEAAIDGPPEKKLKTGAGSSNNEVSNAISVSAQQQNIEMMMANLREDLSLEEDMEPLKTGSFHERPSFKQADEPRGDPSQPTNDQLYSPLVNNDVIVNDAQQREPMFIGEYEWANDFIGGGIELARDRCSLEELLNDTFQTIPRTEPVVQVLEQSNVELDKFSVGAGRTKVEEEEDMVNNSGGVAQPGAGASSSGGLRHNPSETRGAPLLTSPTKLVGQAFEENRNVIWSWLTNDEVSTIGIYGMGGSGKTTMVKHIYNELLQSPDIYHHVYLVTVSQDFSIHKLQNKIAKRIELSFSNEEEELGHRAAELSQKLMKIQRWILILDDLWDSFELHKVGIPVPLKGCKLIMTTRSETVCRQMNSRNNVRVNPLSNEEAWTLFMEELGHDRLLSPQVERVARDITRECDGLPLGIKTIAGTMKGVDDMHEWSDALEDLKQSKVPQDKVEKEVFRILRFSYTHLSSALQQCFLYCGFFPEDFVILRHNLIDYLIDEGVVKQQKSRKAEINKGHTMLDRLEKACLLERLDGGNSVKMHDLIRDMAIQILEENSRAIVKELGFIADSFFKQLHGLKVLDLSRTYIEYLPDSVSDLQGLTSLLLKDCQRLSSVPSLKKLRALTRLDLFGAPLKKIPRGMKYLLNLRYLRMNGCGEKKFPGGILPKLCDLQVFILEALILDNGINLKYPIVTVEGKEVGCLRKLESLECHFEDQSNYLEYLKFRDATQTLRTYKIVVGQLREDHDQRLRYRGSGSKMVVLGNLNINRDANFLVISSNDIQQLICACIDARTIGDVLSLKYSLSSCNSMESLVSSSWFCSAPLPQPSPSYNGIFSALKLLSCYGCKSMKKLFPSVLLPNLVNLEEIEVDDCEKLEEIIGGPRSDEEGAMGEESNEFKLPKLRSLRLQGLPELKSICSAKLICNSLQEIFVCECDSMEILVPSSWSCFLNLERIDVKECKKMEEIIGGTRSDEKGVMGEESISSEFKLPKLQALYLTNLPELKSICRAKETCDSLEIISVWHCEKLKRIPICLPLLENGQPSPPPSLEGIWISPKEWWESTVEWEHPNAKDVLRPFVLDEASTSVFLARTIDFVLKTR